MADRYHIQYADEVVADIRALRAFDRQQVLDGIETHLTFGPAAVSRSRIKRMVLPFWSQFRLRIGDFRVYYDVDEVNRVVNVLRVLRKATASTQTVPP